MYHQLEAIETARRNFTVTPAALNYHAWNVDPLKMMASNTQNGIQHIGGLKAYGGGWDTAQALRGELQRYSSHACQPSSYICGISSVADPATITSCSIGSHGEMKMTQSTPEKIAAIVVTNTARLQTSTSPPFTPTPTLTLTSNMTTLGQNQAPQATSQPSASADKCGLAPSSDPIAQPVTCNYVPIRVITPKSMFLWDKKLPPYTQTYANLLQNYQDMIRASFMSCHIPVSNTGIALTKILFTDGGEFRDVIPLVRLSLLQASLSIDIADIDWTPMTFFRNVVSRRQSTHIKRPTDDIPECRLLAMPIDVFMAFLAGEISPPTPQTFCSSQMDNSWVGIPVSAQMQSSSYVYEYIYAFLTNSLSLGSVSHQHRADTTEGDIISTVVTMPVAATTYIPGPSNAILIMTDMSSNSAQPTIQIKGISVPVYTGRAQPPRRDGQASAESANFTAAWNTWFTTTNADVVRQNATDAWNYVAKNIAVDETVGVALSLASECTAALRQGMYLNPRKTFEYNVERPLTGAFSLRPSSDPPVQKLAPGSRYITTVVALDSPHYGAKMTNRMQGFNFASVSPWHIPPTGVVPLTACDTNSATSFQNATPTPDQYSSLYQAPIASTIKRLATFMGLIQSASIQYPFYTADEMSGFIMFLAQALSANTAALLVAGDLSAREWSGYEKTSGILCRHEEIFAYKKQLTNGILFHKCMEEVQLHLTAYNEEWIHSYYSGMDPYSNRAWYSHSPVPSHLTIQWVEKLKLLSPPSHTDDMEMVHVFDDVWRYMHRLRHDKKNEFLYYLSSFDTENCLPMLVEPYNYPVVPTYGAWIEQASFLSLYTTTSEDLRTRQYTETTTITEGMSRTDKVLYVWGAKANWEEYKLSVSSIQFPSINQGSNCPDAYSAFF